MGKTPKKDQKEKTPIIIRIKKRRKKVNNLYKRPNSIYNKYISSTSTNKNINSLSQFMTLDPIIKIMRIITLLSNYCSQDKLLSTKSLNDLNIIAQNANDSLFADFGKLLNPKEFYECFVSYIKKSLSNNKIQNIYNSIIYSSYNIFFQLLQNKDIKIFLFDNNISSFIRQDIILSIFDYKKNDIDNFIKLFFLDNNCYSKIDKNNLIINESIEDFKKNYLFSNCVLTAIKLTLDKFVNVEIEKIKNTISLLLNKINFYYGNIEENYSAISFLGYNIVIREYFHNFNDDKIKVALRNVLAHEMIHILLIELTDKNYFNRSYERSNGLVQESGEDFEKIFFGIEVNYYSAELIKYLENFNNLKKNLVEFNKDINNIYAITCVSKENLISLLSDNECIQKRIIRNKYNKKYSIKKCEFGHCRKHYMI